MKRADLPAGGIEFTMNVLPGLHFVRFPVEVSPPEKTLCFVNTSHWQCAAIWQDGRWLTAHKRPMNRVPTHWTVMVSEDRPDGE